MDDQTMAAAEAAMRDIHGPKAEGWVYLTEQNDAIALVECWDGMDSKIRDRMVRSARKWCREVYPGVLSVVYVTDKDCIPSIIPSDFGG